MSYTIPTKQPQNLRPGETAILLNGTQAVAAYNSLLPGDIVHIRVRAINADGTPQMDAAGHELLTLFSYEATPDAIAACGSLRAVQKCALMVALGEPFTPLVVDADVAARASIVNKIAEVAAITAVSVAALLSP